MTVGLDTSIVLRLLVGEPAHLAEAARQALDDQPRGSIAISDLVIGETYFALRQHYEVPHARAVAALASLLEDTRVHATGSARHVLAQMRGKDSGPGLMDRLIHAEYRRDDIEFLTFDRVAARMPGARLVGNAR